MVEWNPAEAYVPITECLMTIYINVSIVDKAAKRAESRFSYLLEVSYFFCGSLKSELALKRAISPVGWIIRVLQRHLPLFK